MILMSKKSSIVGVDNSVDDAQSEQVAIARDYCPERLVKLQIN
jgi:hypothetical protein